jgi:hypothetical protein
MSDEPSYAEVIEEYRAMSIFDRIADVQRGLERFAKTERVSGRAGYAFAGINEISDVVRKAFAERGIVMYPEDVQIVESREIEREREGRDGTYKQYQWRTVLRVVWKVSCTVVGGDDDAPFFSVKVVTVGEAIDTSDKSSNKAQTASRKQAMMQLLNISTGDDPDPDHTRPGDDPPPARRRSSGGSSGEPGWMTMLKQKMEARKNEDGDWPVAMPGPVLTAFTSGDWSKVDHDMGIEAIELLKGAG